MKICTDCGKVIDGGDVGYHEVYLGNSHGPKYEYEQDGCACGGDLAEAVQCSDCGEWFYEDEVHGISPDGKLCLNCLSEYVNAENAIEWEAMGEPLKGAFLDYSVADIIELIKRDVAERERLGDPKLKDALKRACLGFDKDEFADFVKIKEEKR